MSNQGIFVLIMLGVMFVLLAKGKLKPGIILFSILTVFMVFGIITIDESLAGFSNKGMLTVFILFFVSEGVRQTGAMNRLIGVLLPKKRGWMPVLLFKMMLPVSLLSSFLNNTPVVIIFAPMIKKWAEKLRLPASKFLIPLSFATILGGMCTLIGTSTNLVVHGLMLENGFKGLTMFELGKVGLFVALAGILYLAFISPVLLPGKKRNIARDPVEIKKYYYNVIIPDKSPFIGKKIVNGHFPGHRDIFVTMLERNGMEIDTKPGETELFADDKLLILGQDSILEQLVSMTGIHIEEYENIDPWFKKKKLVKAEVVISDSFPGIGKTLKEFDFYNYYRGIVAAVQRNGEVITTHTGKVELKAGDCLVVLATPNFSERWKDRRDFYLLSEKGELEIPQSRPRIWFSLGLVILMVIGAALSDKIPALQGNKVDMFFLAACVATIMFWTQIIKIKNYTSVVNGDVLITIACAFGISKGVQNSGLADFVAHGLINLVKDIGPISVLAVIYLVTTVFTEIITNNAAVAIMFPISLSAANLMGVNPHPYFITICIAASASFATPIGYQTNLIVQGIGEYKFNDFMKVGIPLNIIAMLLSILLIPLIWKF
jgi:di/tricarboxylate transporter